MTFVLRAAAGLIAATIVSGCGGFSPPSPSPGGAFQPPAIAAPAAIAHPDTRKSWVAPDAAKTSQLLFVADLGLGNVDMFELPNLKLEGRLTGFKAPTGVCADKHGNVWIADYTLQEMVEYSHGGKQLDKISGVGPQPFACAVNPANGAIAVVNLVGSNGAPGNVLVYASPTAKPTILQNPEMYTYYGAAYDSSGNLWVTGIGTEFPLLSKCVASACSTVITHGGSLFGPDAIAWDGAKHAMIVFDAYCHDSATTCSYPISAAGVIGAPTIYLSPNATSLCGMFGAAIATTGAGTVIVGSDNEYQCTGYKSTSVDVWTYPTGGSPAHAVNSGVIYPWGAAVSAQ